MLADIFDDFKILFIITLHYFLVQILLLMIIQMNYWLYLILLECL